MSKVFLDPLTEGDVKPVGVLVDPSDRAQIATGTWQLVYAGTGLPVVNPPAPPTAIPPAPQAPTLPPILLPVSGNIEISNGNDGSYITTDNPIQWLTPGTYVCQFRLVWNDGQVDNTLSAQIEVQPPAS